MEQIVIKMEWMKNMNTSEPIEQISIKMNEKWRPNGTDLWLEEDSLLLFGQHLISHSKRMSTHINI